MALSMVRPGRTARLSANRGKFLCETRVKTCDQAAYVCMWLRNGKTGRKDEKKKLEGNRTVSKERKRERERENIEWDSESRRKEELNGIEKGDERKK